MKPILVLLLLACLQCPVKAQEKDQNHARQTVSLRLKSRSTIVVTGNEARPVEILSGRLWLIQRGVAVIPTGSLNALELRKKEDAPITPSYTTTIKYPIAISYLTVTPP